MTASRTCVSVGIWLAAMGCTGSPVDEPHGTAVAALSDCEPSASVTLENGGLPAQPIPVARGFLTIDGTQVELGVSMSNALYGWIEASFEKKHAYKDGAIEAGDYDGRHIRAFHGARITHVDFPSSNEATVSLQVATPGANDTTVPVGRADGGVPAACPAGSLFSTSQFRLTVGGTELTPGAVSALSVDVPQDGSAPVAADLAVSFDQLPANTPAGVQAATIDYFAEDGSVALTVNADVELAGTTQSGLVFHVRNVRLPTINPGPPGRLPTINPGPPG